MVLKGEPSAGHCLIIAGSREPGPGKVSRDGHARTHLEASPGVLHTVGVAFQRRPGVSLKASASGA